MTPNNIDKYISADIPYDDKELQKLVFKHMWHVPHTKESSCYVEKKTISKKIFLNLFRITKFVMYKNE